MQKITECAQELQKKVAKATEKLRIPEKNLELQDLDKQIVLPNFWDNSFDAQIVTKRRSKLASSVEPWLKIQTEIAEILELAKLGDSSLSEDLQHQLENCQKNFSKLQKQLKFSGSMDEYDAILSIYAGAGGTDAQDWAQMLLRMYVRWAESHDYEVTTIDESAGEEAGIKSVTIEISGDYIFGKLSSEHGVHRLVRLSPFNSDNLRQTSFAKVEILPKIDKPDAVEIDEKDLKIDVFRSGGHGGQSVNTTDSAVRVTHLPTNIVVAIQNERSQLQNKETAMTILRSKLAQLQKEQHLESLAELKGPNEQAAWGNQIRSYVLHPYKQVKDLRTRYESSDPNAVLDGKIDNFIEAYLEYSIGKE